MMQHSGERSAGGVVGSGWSPPWNTAPVSVCSRLNGVPLKVTPEAVTRIGYTPSRAAIVAAWKRPGCVSAIPTCALAPLGSVTSATTLAR